VLRALAKLNPMAAGAVFDLFSRLFWVWGLTFFCASSKSRAESDDWV